MSFSQAKLADDLAINHADTHLSHSEYRLIKCSQALFKGQANEYVTQNLLMNFLNYKRYCLGTNVWKHSQDINWFTI